MEYTYLKKEKKIVSNDSDIWVDKIGFRREGPVEFVLSYKGKLIGFSGPESDKDRVKTPEGVVSSYTIGNLGIGISRWVGDIKEVYCEEYKFEGAEEQRVVIELLIEFMLAYSGAPKTKSEVFFSKKLQQELKTGGLIVSSSLNF